MKEKKKLNPIALKRRIIFYSLSALLIAAVISFCVFLSFELKYRRYEKEADSTKPDYSESLTYYNSLSYKEQQLYNSVLDAADRICDRTESLPYLYYGETFARVMEFVIADNPDLFYLDSYSCEMYKNRYRTLIELGYYENTDKIEQMKRDFDAALDSAVAGFDPSAGEFEKEVYLHDYLASTCKYPESEGEYLYNTAYGALCLGEAYCDGYGYAFKSLLNRAGIRCCVVYGEAGGNPHVWNIAFIDGKYYNVDVMWNDPDLSFNDELKFHGYFNLTSGQMLSDHTPYYEKIIPLAVDENDYYRRLGLYVEDESALEEVLYNAVLSAVSQGRSYVELYPGFTKDGESLRETVLTAIRRVNAEGAGATLAEAFRPFNASPSNNSLTLQLFYNK